MEKLTQEELNRLIELHGNWLNKKTDGLRLQLSGEDLTGLNFCHTNLHGADLSKVNLRVNDLRVTSLCEANLREADLYNADLQGASLRGADLHDADMRETDLHKVNMRGANLRGANIDYASWPLWCGSLGVLVDRRIWIQLAYHLCSLEVDDMECNKYRDMLLPIANQFHRVKGCGYLQKKSSSES